jgi:hypothetical protein
MNRPLAIGLAVLGSVLGLGALTKLSLVAMIPLAALVVVVLAWRQHGQAPLLRRMGWLVCYVSFVTVIPAAISGWWFWRNWRLYGDPTAVNVFMDILGYRAAPLTLRDLWEEFGTFRRTYWGLFGGVNVPAPEPVYVFYDVLSIVGLVGLGRHMWRRWREIVGIWWIPLLWVGILFAALLRWVMLYYSFQGRLMFPGIAAMSTFLAVGWGEWFPRRWRSTVIGLLCGSLLVLATVVPFVSIVPAYTYPTSLDLADVPAAARESDGTRIEPVNVGGVARVVGWEMAPQVVQPGNFFAYVEFVVYWEATAPDGRDYVSFANVLGRGRQPVGQIKARHLANGMVPTSLWKPGQVWRDYYRVPVAADAVAPSRLLVEVGLYNPQTRETLGTVGIGQAKLAPPIEQPAPDQALEVDLADGVSLQGYDLYETNVAPGERFDVTLYWEARAMPSTDYQVMLHLVGTQPEPVAQGDGPPLMGDYPTGLWSLGEAIVDRRAVSLPEDVPPGQYRLLVGMYDLETLARLARMDGAGDTIEIPTPITVRDISGTR